MADHDDDTGLQAAYALSGPDDNRALYARWAGTYDADFADGMDYRLHDHVAAHFAAAGGQGPVIDLGAGTGLCGVSLAARRIGPIDGTDLSPDMLRTAKRKGVYATLFEADLSGRLPVADGHYAGAVSSGTFTHGHVGPEALAEVMRILRPGGVGAISINTAHWHALRFSAAVDALEGVAERAVTEVPIYGPAARGSHAADTALVVTLLRA